MRNTITRTITTSTINPVMIDFTNGTPTAKDLEPITVHGTITQEEAQKIVRKTHGKALPIVVKSIDTVDKFYEISVADFIKYAHVVEKPIEDEAEN